LHTTICSGESGEVDHARAGVVVLQVGGGLVARVGEQDEPLAVHLGDPTAGVHPGQNTGELVRRVADVVVVQVTGVVQPLHQRVHMGRLVAAMLHRQQGADHGAEFRGQVVGVDHGSAFLGRWPGWVSSSVHDPNRLVKPYSSNSGY